MSVSLAKGKRDESEIKQQEYFEKPQEEEFTCPTGEFYTINGCVTCKEAFPDCQKCYNFKGVSDGSQVYATPIYHSPDDRRVKEYWACSACDTGFDMDFFGQTCTQPFSVTIDTKAIECQINKGYE